MSLLTLVTKFCARTGLPVPIAVMSATDAQLVQVRALLEEEIEILAPRYVWESQQLEQTITTIPSEDQGALTSLTSSGFRWITNQTIWSHDRRLPVAGPLDARQWQALKALFVNGPYYRFRIRGGHLLVNPVPPAGETWVFEYVTRHGILDADGVTTKEFLTADTDTFLIPEAILRLGLRWRWKKEKGLEYAQDFDDYELLIKDLAGHDGGKVPLHMDQSAQRDAMPGIFVPNGNWSVP